MERKCFHIFILLYFYFSEFPACIRVIQLPLIIWDPWNPLQVQLGFLSLLMLQLERKYCSKYFLQCTNTYKNSCYNCWKIKPSMWRSYFQMVHISSNFSKGCLSQNLLNPLLNTLSQMFRNWTPVRRFPGILLNIVKEYWWFRIREAFTRR